MNDDSDSSFDVLQYVRAGRKRIAIASLLGLVGGLAHEDLSGIYDATSA